ncbi:MAG: cytochrome c biogenesis protein CcsA [Pseudomonadota bacterium]
MEGRADRKGKMAAILFHIGLVAYGIGSFGHLASLVRERPGGHDFGDRALTVGFLFHGASVLLRAIDLVQGGAFRFAEGLSFVAFLTVGLYLLVGRSFRIPILGAFVAPLVVVILLPAHAFPDPSATPPPWMGWIRPLHIAMALSGLALFALGFLISTLYLLLQRELKTKRPGAMFRRLPSLAQLDRMTQQVMTAGFVLLTLTLLTGVLFPVSSAESSTLRQLTKEAMGVVAWGLTAAILVLRQILGWRGRRVALATMMGFFCLAIAFAGVFVGRPV